MKYHGASRNVAIGTRCNKLYRHIYFLFVNERSHLPTTFNFDTCEEAVDAVFFVDIGEPDMKLIRRQFHILLTSSVLSSVLYRMVFEAYAVGGDSEVNAYVCLKNHRT